MPTDNGVGTMLFALAGPADADNIGPAIWSVARDGTPVSVYVADAVVYRTCTPSGGVRNVRTSRWSPWCHGVNVVSCENASVDFDGTAGDWHEPYGAAMCDSW